MAQKCSECGNWPDDCTCDEPVKDEHVLECKSPIHAELAELMLRHMGIEASRSRSVVFFYTGERDDEEAGHMFDVLDSIDVEAAKGMVKNAKGD